MTKLIGLTGRIGAGKSMVCRCFNELGVRAFDSDACAKEQYKNPRILSQVVSICGDVLDNDGKLDKKKLADVVFKDDAKLNAVTELISNGVFSDFNRFVKDDDTDDYVIFESAIIFKRNLQDRFDAIVVVTADFDTRFERVKHRSNLSVAEFMYRDNKQNDHCDLKNNFLIVNNSGKEELKKRVLEIHNELRGCNV